MFECMENSESIYEGVFEKPSKNPTYLAYANRDGHIRENRVEFSLSNYNPEKGSRAGKHKTINTYNPSGKSMGKHCMFHGYGHSSEECKSFVTLLQQNGLTRGH